MFESLYTFILYMAVYGISSLFFYLSDKTYNNQKRNYFVFLGGLILIIFAGLRDYSVGTDTENTLTLYFDFARKTSIVSIIKSNVEQIPYYIISKILISLGLGSRTFLIILEFLIVFPVIVVACIRRKSTPVWITMLWFDLLYFQLSFNWIRQSIAASILLLAVVLYLNHKQKFSIFLGILSIFFHSSAIIGILIFVLAYLTSKSKNKYFKIISVILVLIIAFFVMRYWEIVSLWLINKGILPQRYSSYVNVFSGNSSVRSWFKVGTRTYVEYALRVLFFIVPTILCYRKKMNKDLKRIFYFFQICSFFSLLIYTVALFGLNTAYGNRITYYLDLANIVYFGFSCMGNIHPKRGVYSLNFLIILVLCVTYNIWLYYVLGWHATVPYIFL